MAEITAGNDLRKLGTLGTDGVITAYLDPGWHMLTAVTADDQIYGSQGFYLGENPVDFTIVEGTNDDGPVVKPPKPTDPEPDVPDENPDYKLFLLTLTIYNQNILMDYPSAEDTPWYDDRENVRSVELKEGVTKIGTFSFAETNVRTVTMASKVTEIGESAFSGCEDLKTLIFPGTMEEWKQVKIAEGNEALKKATIHCADGDVQGSSGDSGKEPDGEGKVVASGECGENGGNAEWTLYDNGVLNISGNGYMKSYDENTCLSKTVWKNVKVVKIQHISNAGAYAFYGCEELTKVEITGIVFNVYEHAFENCAKLKEIDGRVSGADDSAFKNCSSLKTIEKVEFTYVGNHAFDGCSALESIEFSSLIKIGECAFRGCNQIVDLNLSENLKEVGAYAFANCKKLEKVNYEYSREFDDYIWEGTFYGCENLTEINLPTYCSMILEKAFFGCKNLKDIRFGYWVERIGAEAFQGCDNLKIIYYDGSISRWRQVRKGEGNDVLERYTVHCSDGDVEPKITASENSITTGAASTSGSKFQATFANAKAGKEYVVLVSRAKYNSLSADNLIYINQITADADGELAVPFITAADATEMIYVVACAQDDASVEPGQPDKPNQPDQPGGDEPSSGGGDGGGAAIILIGGVAAVAAVAGAVMLMPVKVEGTVKLADQPVANATVQVLKNGNVAAQTTTDANGHFTVKVKRGGYTLRVQWTDAESQPVVRTVDFKAPNANLNVAA